MLNAGDGAGGNAAARVYHAEIMRLAKGYVFAGAPAGAVQVVQTNPLCGDRTVLHVQLRDGMIASAAHDTRGCALCVAAGEVLMQQMREMPQLAEMTRVARGLVEAFAVRGGLPAGMEMFTPVLERRSRYECVLLPYRGVIVLGESV